MAIPTRAFRRAARVAVATVALGLLVAGCSDAGDQVVGDPSASKPSTSTSGAEPSTTSTSGAADTTSTSAATTTTQPFDGGTDRVAIPAPATTQEVVSHTDLAITAAGGEERITFGFEGALPGVIVDYVARPVRESGPGDEVAVEGAAVLGIRFEPASSATLDGEDVTRTYTGPDRVPGPGGTVAEVVRTGDFEAVYEWAAGLAAEVPFRVDIDAAGSTVTIVVPAR